MPYTLSLYHPDTPDVLRHQHREPDGTGFKRAARRAGEMLGMGRRYMQCDGQRSITWRRQQELAASDVTMLARWERTQEPLTH
tara:strand:+ start:1961 stop:2209 length:249 start_codon:yes stop_codon:yes gene_type:complete